MVVEESIHDESNNSLQEIESFDDDLGLETSMRKLQIEDRRQQEEVVEDPKKEESPLALPSPQQVQGESSQNLPKDWKFVINHPQDQIIEVYVEQPPDFQSFNFPNHVFRLKNALYGLKQAPRACEFEMSMMGELNFFLGLQIKQLKEGTFINQAKYIRDLLKRFNMEKAKTMKTPMSSFIKLDMDEKGKFVNSTMYRGMIGERREPLGLRASALLSHLSLSRRRLAERRVGLRLYEAKAWPTVSGFEPREVVQRLCGLVDAQGMGKPSAHNLIVPNRVLHHMICSILLPRGGHRDEVSYLKAFIMDTILTGRQIHVGYLMMMHMISCVESTTRVLPMVVSLPEYSMMPRST
ncbi:hypothetical protein CK203_015539 [Vitis vinifera]|uniref:Reverse transcriptase Ty1/copia-type domain-containing protein n=1 Tax=Vitis vinifera TaxID=29760 RepID=A0A438J5M6_VITVI|nr:hypothetical protein CK203_015539 [Vitis vinifera]